MALLAARFKIHSSRAAVPDDTHCVEFTIGPDYLTADRSTSAFLDDEIFEFLADVFHSTLIVFNPPLGPTTVSNQKLIDLSEALRAYGKRIGNAEDPAEIWGSERVRESVFESPDDWPEHRQSLGLLIRDLRRWLRAAHARGEHVTIF